MEVPQSSHDFSYHFASRADLQLLQIRGGLSQSRWALIVVPQSAQEISYHFAAWSSLQDLQMRGGLLQSSWTLISA
jgi:hypothetical protein